MASIAAHRDRDLDALTSLWADRPGVAGWLGTIDHKRIACRYFASAGLFLVLGVVLAVLMRSQLAEAEADLVGAASFRQLADMHGASMLLLAVVPMLQALALYLVPLMVGTRTIAFPRLNAFGFWLFLFGGLATLSTFALALWRSLAGVGAGMSVEAASWQPALVAMSTLCVALGVCTTILRMRAPGMTLSRMPTFVSAMLVASVLVLIILGPATAQALLDAWSARVAGVAGSVMASPWPAQASVLFLSVLPVVGVIAGIIETMARRPLVGPIVVHAALLAIGLLVLAAWASDALGIEAALGEARLRGALAIATALPLLVLLACWLRTLAQRGWRPELAHMPSPLLYALAAMQMLVVAGIGAVARWGAATGAGDDQYAVAQVHYLAGAALFALFGALHVWFPKITGRMLSDAIGRLQFWLFFVGFNATFLPLYWLGLAGMPRGVHTYASGLGWTLPNTVSTLGTWMTVAGGALLAFNLYYALRQGRPAGDNPWGAPDLAWATHSPPPPCNFTTTPTVHDRQPAWSQPTQLEVDDGGMRRTVLLTSPARALPRGERALPRPTLFPLVAGLAVSGLVEWSTSPARGLAWSALALVAVLGGWYLRGSLRS